MDKTIINSDMLTKTSTTYPTTDESHTNELDLRQTDRRTFSTQTLMRSMTQPRRSRGRRSSDRHFPLLDVFTSAEMFMAVALMLLSLTDAVFTLTLISRGGTELNPVMNYFLNYGVFPFVAVKFLLTGVAAIVMVGAGNYLLFGKVRVRSLLGAAIGIYAGLVFYEIGLLWLSS